MKNTMRVKSLLAACLGALLLVWLLSSCAQPAPTSVEVIKTVEVVKEVVKTVEVQVGGETIIVTATPAPAPAEPAHESPVPQPSAAATESSAAVSTPLPVPSATALPLPVQPTSTAISPFEPPTPTTFAEIYLTEVEWPPRLRLGDSDVVRLSLIPSAEGYTIKTEFPEHQAVTQTMQVTRPGGYDLFAAARLEGVGFEITPGGEKVQYMQPGQELTWRWSLTPRRSGQQRLFVALALRWVPLSAQGGAVREVMAYSTGLDVQVVSFLGMTQSQAAFAGVLGLIFGALLSLAALILRPPRPAGGMLRHDHPNLDLVIELPPGLQLSQAERRLLQTLFRRYARLVVQEEFLSGYSGARTFLALPVRPDGRADAHTIAKLGERGSIQHEFENYEQYVKDTLPPITARIQQPPVAVASGRGERRRGDIPPAAGWAALRYTFIGEPGSKPTSLRQALLADPDPALLLKLFETFGPNWWMQRRPHTFRLAQEYDRMLPTHLVLEAARGDGPTLDGRTPPGRLNLQPGDLATLRHFRVEEVRADGRSLSLVGPAAPGQPPLRVRWLSMERPEGACGRVTARREDLLREAAAGCDLLGVPDPLPRLPELLNETISGTQSTVHGDLNLENVLVGPGGLVWLIDFARTRDAHTLFDFAHLDAEIVAHLLAPQIKTPQEYLALLRAPQDSPYARLYALRAAVDEIAGHCLFNASQRREFDLALALAHLGALKYANLDAHARSFLYLSAAVVVERLL